MVSFPVLSLRCHTCPASVNLRDCIAYSPQECASYENGCFFEYHGRIKKMGCGRDWHRPAGCDGSLCIKWCHSDLCNKDLIKHSPFKKELGEESSSQEDSGNWLSSLFGGSAITEVSLVVLNLLLVFNVAVILLL